MGTGYLPHFSLFLHQFSWHPNRSKIQTFLHFHFSATKRKNEQNTEKEIDPKLMHYKQNNQIEEKKKGVLSSSSSCSSPTSTLALLRLLFLNSTLLILLLPDLFFLRWLGVKITNSSLKDKFNSLSGKLNHSLDRILR